MNLTSTLLLSFILLTILFYCIILKASSFSKKLVVQHTRRRSIKLIVNFIVLFTLIVYVIVSLFNLIGNVSNITWLLVFIILYTMLLIILVSSLRTISTLLIVHTAFVLLLLLVLSSIKTSGLKPLMNDEGRYIGFSYRILEESFWKPFKYPENTYYQSFHVLPCLYSILSITLRSSPEGIPYVILLLIMSIAGMIALYLVAKMILYRSIPCYKLHASIMPLIAFTTPPLALVGILPRALSYTLFLITFYMLLSFAMKHRRTTFSELIIIVLLSITGTMLHALYPYLSLITTTAFILAIVFLLKYNVSSHVVHYMLRTMIVILLIACIYWAYTSALYAMVASVKNVTSGFTKFYTEMLIHGGIPAKYAIREPWYTKVPRYILLSWTFMPAIATAYILYLLPHIRKTRYMSGNVMFKPKLLCIMSMVGLTVIGLSYIQRFTSGLALYLGYKAYTLILPSVLAYYLIVYRSKSTLRYVLASVLALCAVLGVTSPDVRADMLNIRPTGTQDGWIVAKSIYSLISDEYTKNVDRELRIGLNAMLLKYNPSLFEFYNHRIQSSIALTIIKQYCSSEHMYKRSNLVLHTLKYIGVLQSVKSS